MNIKELNKASALARKLLAAETNWSKMKSITISIENALPVVIDLIEMPVSNFVNEREARKTNESTMRYRDYVGQIFEDKINEIKEELTQLGVTFD